MPTDEEIAASCEARQNEIAQLMHDVANGAPPLFAIEKLLAFVAQERQEIAKLQIQISRLLAWHDLAIEAQARREKA